jgi:RimJ/RimL family protein N-acetyltransferase
MRYLGGAALSRAQSDDILLGAGRCFAESGYGKIAVERIEDGAFLGTCGLSNESWYPDDLEIGWRLARSHWGCGYASEAAAAWMDYAFGILNAPRIISISDAPNVRSIAVMKKIGLRFDHEARLREGDEWFDAVVYSRSFADWQARQAG